MEMEKRRGRERAQWNTVTGKVRERERGETEDKTERGGREREEKGDRREKREERPYVGGCGWCPSPPLQ